MPTGYTYGILEGNITSFTQFAKVCMEAFVHSVNEKQIPSDTHLKAIERAKQELEDLKSLCDEELLIREIRRLKQEQKSTIESKEISLKRLKDLDKILNDIYIWNPPSEYHNNFKEFMINQIQQTISSDCELKHLNITLERISKELNEINIHKIREELKEEILEGINYHTKKYDIEVKECEENNKWVEELLKSLP